jgi:uncharacterized protein
MRILVTGGTGFIGSAVVKALKDRGDEVIIVSRRASVGGAANIHSGVSTVTWDELAQKPESLGAVDGIVNLAGETVGQRWTAAAKTRILQSRLSAAQRIADYAASLPGKPRIVVNASGISSYGWSLTETFDERSPSRETDFLASVVSQWEAAADRIEAERLVKLRVGFVVAARGGSFPLMALPYRLFAGGRVGSGRQWLSWIHLEDIVRLILFCLDNTGISGPVNASAPEPMTNDQFGRAIGEAMRRPHWLPIPAFMMKAILGEMATLLLEGQRVLPQAALDAGFSFRYPTADLALRSIYGRQQT